MTLEELKQSGSIVFECISGSKAYGLATETSDTDIRGVFILPKHLYYGFTYIDQISNHTNDIVYYELNKFLELCAKNNPSMLELLHTPEASVLYKHPLFNKVLHTPFLSKQCELSFSNYAFAQIKKAQGLQKKIVNPMDEIRKTVLDFCYVYYKGSTYSFNKFLYEKGIQKEHCGLSNLPHFKNCYNLYYSSIVGEYNGIISSTKANDVCLSNITKNTEPLAVLYVNKEGYATYCKKYKEYWDWVAKRNEARYNANVANNKSYDAKNMMHTFRLLHMAEEIAAEGTVHVERTDREYLLAIKNGEFTYEELLEKAEVLQLRIASLFSKSMLPESIDKEMVSKLAVAIRDAFYSQK